MKKIVSLIAILTVLFCSNGMLTQAANKDISVTSVQDTKDITQHIINPYGYSMTLYYHFQYSDGNTVAFSGANYVCSGGPSQWLYSAKITPEGDRRYVTIIWYVLDGRSFETKVWCDIYGDSGIVY